MTEHIQQEQYGVALYKRRAEFNGRPHPPLALTHPTLHVRFTPALIVVRFFRKRF